MQENGAKAAVAGEDTTCTPRFVKTACGVCQLDEASLARARWLVGLTVFVTNIEATIMPPAEVIAGYRDPWRVEQSLRVSRTNLRARPIFNHTGDAIEAQLTIAFVALAASREVQNGTGLAIRSLIRHSRPLR